jgi:hypothetical protein
MTAETKRTCLEPKALRAVSFSPNVMVQFTTHKKDYKQRDIQACWYTKSDYKKIREEIKITLDLIKRKVDIDDYNHCKRGLESLTQKGARHERMQTKLEARTAVFKEQDLQDNEGIVDPEILAMVYSNCTRSCQVAAYVKGVLDKWAALGSDVGSKTTSRQKSDRFRVASTRQALTMSVTRCPIATYPIAA